jgi:hypothetical protein
MFSFVVQWWIVWHDGLQTFETMCSDCFYFTCVPFLMSLLFFCATSCPTATESTNDRVKWFSVSEFIVLLITNVWQIYSLRQFFEKRSRIWVRCTRGMGGEGGSTCMCVQWKAEHLISIYKLCHCPSAAISLWRLELVHVEPGEHSIWQVPCTPVVPFTNATLWYTWLCT